MFPLTMLSPNEEGEREIFTVSLGRSISGLFHLGIHPEDIEGRKVSAQRPIGKGKKLNVVTRNVLQTY